MHSLTVKDIDLKKDGLAVGMIVIIVVVIVVFIAISFFIFYKWVMKCICGDSASSCGDGLKQSSVSEAEEDRAMVKTVSLPQFKPPPLPDAPTSSAWEPMVVNVNMNQQQQPQPGSYPGYPPSPPGGVYPLPGRIYPLPPQGGAYRRGPPGTYASRPRTQGYHGQPYPPSYGPAPYPGYTGN